MILYSGFDKKEPDCDHGFAAVDVDATNNKLTGNSAHRQANDIDYTLAQAADQYSHSFHLYIDSTTYKPDQPSVGALLLIIFPTSILCNGTGLFENFLDFTRTRPIIV